MGELKRALGSTSYMHSFTQSVLLIGYVNKVLNAGDNTRNKKSKISALNTNSGVKETNKENLKILKKISSYPQGSESYRAFTLYNQYAQGYQNSTAWKNSISPKQLTRNPVSLVPSLCTCPSTPRAGKDFTLKLRSPFGLWGQ